MICPDSRRHSIWACEDGIVRRMEYGCHCRIEGGVEAALARGAVKISNYGDSTGITVTTPMVEALVAAEPFVLAAIDAGHCVYANNDTICSVDDWKRFVSRCLARPSFSRKI